MCCTCCTCIPNLSAKARDNFPALHHKIYADVQHNKSFLRTWNCRPGADDVMVLRQELVHAQTLMDQMTQEREKEQEELKKDHKELQNKYEQWVHIPDKTPTPRPHRALSSAAQREFASAAAAHCVWTLQLTTVVSTTLRCVMHCITRPVWVGLCPIHTGRTGANASKWNVLLRMGVFALDASSIKGIVRMLASSVDWALRFCFSRFGSHLEFLFCQLTKSVSVMRFAVVFRSQEKLRLLEVQLAEAPKFEEVQRWEHLGSFVFTCPSIATCWHVLFVSYFRWGLVNIHWNNCSIYPDQYPTKRFPERTLYLQLEKCLEWNKFRFCWTPWKNS